MNKRSKMAPNKEAATCLACSKKFGKSDFSVLTNIPERVEEVYEAGRLGKSDHVIMTKISVGGEEEEKLPLGKVWRRANWESMKDELSDHDWITVVYVERTRPRHGPSSETKSVR